jgi:CubicO group peptidase (beta-lactamase class C family)
MDGKFFFKLYISILFVSTVWNVHAQTSDFEKFVAQAMLDRTVAGVSIARIESGEIVEKFALSHPNVDKLALSENSVFQVGSISKPVAAWAVMTLVRDGKVELDAPISRYLSRWNLPSSNFDPKQVTVERLLSHTAGLSLHGYPGFAENMALPNIEASLSGDTNGAGSVEQILSPGVQFKYSGGGYTLLQLMVEEVSGMPFPQYAQQAIFEPLAMGSSSYEPSQALKALRATPYVRTTPIDYYQFRAQAAASLHSTASDLAQFALANMQQEMVLDAPLIEKMHSPVMDIGSQKVGLGFFIDPKASLIGHSGANQGWRADLVFNPRLNNGLVVLTNSDNAGFFIQQVRCYWEEQFAEAALLEMCQKQIQSHKSQLQMLHWVIWGLIAVSIALVTFRVISLTKGKTQIGLPNSKVRWTLIVLLALIIIAATLLLNTSFGVYIIAGITTSLSAMDYVPEGVPNVWFAIQVLLIFLLLFIFARKVQ